ncbi:MAG: hypothetical protein IH988_03645 [Planctomycetes bacterium]|nr:hypothetical protein [Planctomycetota bacterium]
MIFIPFNLTFLLMAILDLYLLAVTVRWIGVAASENRTPTGQFARFCNAVEVPVRYVERAITRIYRRAAPVWLAWLVVLLPILVTRQLLAGMVFRSMTPLGD